MVNQTKKSKVPAAVLEATARAIGRPNRQARRAPVRKVPRGIANGDDEDDGRRVFRFPETSPFYSKLQVLELVGVTYPALWEWMRKGHFPLAVELGPNERRSAKIGWIKVEVDQWIADRPRRVLKPAPLGRNRIPL